MKHPYSTSLAIMVLFAGCQPDPELVELKQQYAVAKHSSDSLLSAYNEQKANEQAAREIWKNLRNNPDKNIGKEIRFPRVKVVYISSYKTDVKGWLEGDSDLPIWIRSAEGTQLRSGEGVPKFYTGDILVITGKMSGLSEGGLPIIDIVEIINLGV